ncbi:MAG: ATP-grasp domain-containing protein [Thermoanaerobaculia bacterium]|nr:ATP-grasp domain-containing protein [Thermoanaerobaculia bacterium]
MAYLILDPIDPYAWEMMEFLDRVGERAVAVFTTPRQYDLWRYRFAEEWGHLVDDAYLAPQYPTMARLAQEIASRWPQLSGVIPWDERSVLLGAELGERLKLGWNPYHVIERCRDKGVMKAWLRRHASVRLNAAETVTDAAEALDFQRRVGEWPIVVKPTAGAGSIDVFFAHDDQELLSACQRVLRAGAGEVLLEEYIGGEEYAINGMVDTAGDLLVTDIWKYDRRTIHGVPNLYYHVDRLPSRSALFGLLGDYAALVVEALELRRAPIHMEVKVDDRGPCLIEVGARFGGGNLPTLASQLHGRSLFELAACHYIAHLPLRRHDVDHERYDRLFARLVSGIQEQPLARIQGVLGVAEAERLESFAGFGLLRRVGQPAPKTLDLDTIGWEAYLIHPDEDQVVRDSIEIRRLVSYR